MKFGYLSLNSASGIRPADLAVELEQRGFDSVWMPEHSHIPTSRDTPYPAGGDLPEGYWHMMDPFVSLATAAQATSTIELYTGISLILEHDLLELACSCSTLDVLSEGRFRLGVGVGWNREELANHRPDLPFARRYSAMQDRVAALRAAWAPGVNGYEGEFDRFSESWVEPKPVNGTIPVALGNAGPVGIGHAAGYADEWCPIDASMLNTGGRPDVPGAIELFRTRAAEAGRDPDTIPISVFPFRAITPQLVEMYEGYGVTRLVASPPTNDLHDIDTTLRRLDSLADVVAAG